MNLIARPSPSPHSLQVPCGVPVSPLFRRFQLFLAFVVPGGGKRVVGVVQGVGCGLVGHVEVDWGSACRVGYLINKVGSKRWFIFGRYKPPFLSRSSSLGWWLVRRIEVDWGGMQLNQISVVN